MSTRTRLAIQNTIATIEAATADSDWCGRRSWKHRSVTSIEALRSVRDASRAFTIGLVGDRELLGDIEGNREPGTVSQSLAVTVIYPMSGDETELMIVVAEDIDRLSYQLSLVSLWDGDLVTPRAPGLWRRRLAAYNYQPGKSSGDVAVLTLQVEVSYRPVFG